MTAHTVFDFLPAVPSKPDAAQLTGGASARPAGPFPDSDEGTAHRVSDFTLARLARLDTTEPGLAKGEFPVELQAELAMILPDIARELIMRRQLTPIPEGALCLAMSIEAIEAKLEAARAAFRSGAALSPREWHEHARVLSLHSSNHAERAAAFQVLNTRTGGGAA